MRQTNQSRENAVAETAADINRQYREYSSQRDAMTTELASICTARQRGNIPERPPLSDAERRARDYAKQLLNGHSPASWTVPPDTSREAELLAKRRGLDLVLDVLSKSEIALRQAEAAQRAEDRADEWQKICRAHVLAAARLDAAEKAAVAFINDVAEGGTPLLLWQYLGRLLPISFDDGSRIEHEIEAALRERIVTRAEIKDSQNVE